MLDPGRLAGDRTFAEVTWRSPCGISNDPLNTLRREGIKEKNPKGVNLGVLECELARPL
jgi:hypothetical protein